MSTCVSVVSFYLNSGATGTSRVLTALFVPVTPQPSDLSTCAYVVLSGSEVVQSAAAAAPFDPVLAAAYWSFAMTFGLGLYLFSKNLGMILAAIRRF